MPLMHEPAEMKPLRDYQAQILDDVLAAFGRGKRKVLVSLPTGGGKTRIALEMAARARAKGNRFAVLCERVVLCNQWVREATKIGLDCGKIQATSNRLGEDLTAYSQQTIEKRIGRPRSVLPHEEIVVVDECHVQRAAITDWIRGMSDRFVVGLTATPQPEGLADTYDALVQGPTTDQLRQAGWLIPERVMIARAKIDMTGARVGDNGEWIGSEIDEAVAAVIGDVPREWLRVCEERFGGDGDEDAEIPRTIVFSATIASGKLLMDAWNALGLGEIAGQISCYDTDKERDDALNAFQSGEKPVLINVSVVGRGFDCPEASVLVDASPYRSSITAYAQMLGRVLRPSEGRARDGEYALVLDHGGNYERFYDQWKRFCRDGVEKLLPDKPDPGSKGTSRWLEAWRCGSCDAMNPLRTKRCGEDPGVDGCGAMRCDGDDAASSGRPAEFAWRCGVCRSVNVAEQKRCRKHGCEGRAPAAKPGEDDEKRAWECKACGAMNDLRETKCCGCGEPRPKHFEELEGELEEVAFEEPVGVKHGANLQIDRKYVWAHLSELALRHYLKTRKNVTSSLKERARKLAGMRYKTLYGVWPNYPLHLAREPYVDPRIENWWQKKAAEYREQKLRDAGYGYGRRGGYGPAPQAAI